MKKFKCKWDWLNIIVTTITSIILPVTFCVYYLHSSQATFWIMLIICLPLFITPLFFCPISVEKEGNDLWINFLLRRKHIDLSDCYVEKIHKIGAFEYMRTLGASAFFGYWGYFAKEGQSYLFYLTNSKENLCLISSATKSRKLMINAPYDWFVDDSEEQ